MVLLRPASRDGCLKGTSSLPAPGVATDNTWFTLRFDSTRLSIIATPVKPNPRRSKLGKGERNEDQIFVQENEKSLSLGKRTISGEIKIV